MPSKKAIEGQKKLKEIQPEVDQIRQQYPNDRQKQSIEMMELYKKKNVSMFSSCLPTLIQLPVLIALYYAFSNGLDPSRQSLIYSFVPYPETINRYLFGIDLTNPDKTYILPIIAGAIQFIQTKMMTPKVTKSQKADPSVAMQQNMVYMFPILTVMISRSFAAALPLYWIVSSAFQTIQQYYLMKDQKKPIEANRSLRSDQLVAGGQSETDKKKESRNHPSTTLGAGKIAQGDNQIKPSTEKKKGIELTVRRKN